MVTFHNIIDYVHSTFSAAGLPHQDRQKSNMSTHSKWFLFILWKAYRQPYTPSSSPINPPPPLLPILTHPINSPVFKGQANKEHKDRMMKKSTNNCQLRCFGFSLLSINLCLSVSHCVSLSLHLPLFLPTCPPFLLSLHIALSFYISLSSYLFLHLSLSLRF